MRTKRIISSLMAVLGVAMVLGPSSAIGSQHDAFPVEGSGVHYFTDAVIHSQEPTATGMIQRSTETVKVSGDLRGHLLYHVTSDFDFVSNTMVNTGTQFFSGTVGDSEPVVLHDDEFRFVVDLTSGATTGEVHLSRSVDAPDKSAWFECDLSVVGTGMTPEGNATFDYSGECIRKGEHS